MNIFTLELRNNRKSVFVWAISVSCIIFMLLAFFPSMQTDSMQQLAKAKLEGVDPALLAALGLEIMPDFTIITHYFGYILQFITLAIMVFITQKAVSMLIREETDGTIEFLYGRPVSRTDIYFQKLLANIVAYVVFLVLLCAVTVAGYAAFSDFALLDAIREAAVMFGGVLYAGLVFLSVGALLSAVIGSNRSSSAVTIAIVFGTFVLGLASVVVDKLDFLAYFSPMDWIKTAKLLTTGIAASEWAVGITVIVASLSAAAILYSGKDMKV